MAIIQTLPAEVVHLIAAGETIDSLAAVVRELAENAIDAGATRLVISLWTDTFSIQVSDNGCGMSLEDLERAATPHTTSKIHSTDDLQRITSLGFRGEALHSLAQLANLQICSRQHGDASGWQINCDRTGNSQGSPKVVAIAPGTVVSARHIFAPYPSRVQALPALAQQLRKIQMVVQQMAIANPHLTWQVNLDDRIWIAIWPGKTARDILPQIVSSIQPVDLVGGQWVEAEGKSKIQIALGLPDRASRRRPDWVKVAINGRIVQFPEIEQAILSAFARTLPRHRYPVCIAHLTVPPAQVDWNRHPAKTEVYLHNLSYWQEKVGSAIASTLQAPDASVLSSPSAATAQLWRTAEQSRQYLTTPHTPHSTPYPVKALAQVHNTYILAEHAAGLWLVEQHVAHERILFEDLEREWQIVPLEQPMIASNLSEERVERLQALGVNIEPFGSDLWVVRSLPAILVGREDRQDILLELSRQDDPQLARATAACRSAIRNGTPLDLAAMQDLLAQWQQTRNPHTCPHGRPICLSLESTDLARFFRRNWIISKN